MECLRPTSDNGFIVGGRSASPAGQDKSQNVFGDEDFWVVKLSSEGPLPVTLSHFDVRKEEKTAQLNWATAFDGAAAILKIPPTTLASKMKKLGIKRNFSI
ncbi:hypothetical protein SAMN05216327_106392 [Dyadobacter sp. SG02]|uniref:hypothetical protein n=1 Tax=Dyadobacter sp. SG02 TaxID=1855291 RepID=UPI0008B5FCA5|nr:hypothetical protein [Dyadobacter sp. SG02]SEJ15837.1 hypothetical protein SAMN05216327_106392 [Dyadobacter sp. SG02]